MLYDLVLNFLLLRYRRAFCDYWRLYDEHWSLRPTLSDRQLGRYHWRMDCASNRALFYYDLLTRLGVEEFFP